MIDLFNLILFSPLIVLSLLVTKSLFIDLIIDESRITQKIVNNFRNVILHVITTQIVLIIYVIIIEEVTGLLLNPYSRFFVITTEIFLLSFRNFLMFTVAEVFVTRTINSIVAIVNPVIYTALLFILILL